MNAVRKDNRIRIYNAYAIRESLKEITGRFYDPDEKSWVIPYTKENVGMLALLGVELGEGLMETKPDVVSQTETPIIPMPIKATPYQHQVRAYNFALRTFGIGGSA